MLGAEIQGPVSRIVASADSATKEMNRLGRILRDSFHPITEVIKLQLQEMRAGLKKMRHSAMETISKRIIPDDMRIYIVDYSSVLPCYTKQTKKTLRVQRDSSERAFERVEPATLAT
jgi:hypothetical protein